MDFSEKYELYACLQCGKCTGGCPVALRAPLNIRSLMREVLLGGNPDRALDHLYVALSPGIEARRVHRGAEGRACRGGKGAQDNHRCP
jgi:NADPH-dependent glutamate synthase beta subunit-like oxidoreductase